MSDFLCKISIKDIDLSDERYKISFSQNNISFLADSIRQQGLITPPLVRPLNGKFIIISGFNRVKAMLYNNRDQKISVYKTDPDTTDYQCLVKSITALSFKRPLTHAELIISTSRLYKFLDKKQIAKNSCAIFNMELSTRFIEDLLTIGALPDPVLELIHLGNMSLKPAKRIASYEKETIQIFINIFSKIKASNNKQLEIILHIMEIAARDGIKPADVYKNVKIQAILFDDDKNPGLKTKDLRSFLFKLRFPSIFKANQNIQKKINTIKLGDKIKFSPPQNFESQNFSISFTAKNYKEFVKRVQSLNASLENIQLKEILK